MVEALGRAAGALVPGRGVAAVEADVRGRAGGGDDRRRDVPGLHPRRVDDHVGHVVALEEGERLAAVLVVEPARVPELDQHLVAAELLLRPLEVLERRGLEDDVGRQLHQDPAELARLAQRLQRLVEAAEDLGPELARRPVDAAARVERRRLAQVGRQLLGLDRVARHHAEGLHVHHEPVGRALGPVLHHVLVREPVVGRVRLDHVEAARRSSAAAPRRPSRPADRSTSSATRRPRSRSRS